ncbi:Nucleic acid- OB-fold [Chlorella sorokiniana]|uniref:Nucleic acid-OB-fold n=1 Tax=Chlorella sorokiniana TaxID=3076 RepID=A0A2P6THT6_CHLSO|nr:Nucleic acid- OB-fold [Chlorella sorokiniana]|eukprot:PRW33839.1 Nucleic acid- OB-fold [Chlorella sorokiniana]
MSVKQKPVFSGIEALRPDTSGWNLVVKVVDAKVVVDKPARGPLKPQKVAECTVGDASGVVLLTARNEQVELMKPGTYVTLRNAKVDMFRGSMRLAVNQWGKIEPASGHNFEPKLDNNLSLVEFELIPVPQPEKPAAAAEAPAVAAEFEAAPAPGGEEAAAEPAAAAEEAPASS